MPVRYSWDEFVLDLDAYRLERAGSRLVLEPKAFALLTLLVSRPGHLFTKQEIFDAVWPDTAVSDQALTRVVAQIRKVLGDDVREARYLETVPTKGYRWICPTEQGAASGPQPVEPRLPEHAGPRPLAWVAAGLVISVALGLAVVATRVAAPVQPLVEPEVAASSIPTFPVQLTTHPGLDLQPAQSPQGDAVAFSSDRTGAFEIYVRTLDSGAIDMPLTSDGAHNVQPSWSPDGRFITYHSAARGGIWVVPARGGTPRQIVARGSNPDWSPDGRLIVFQSDEHADMAPAGFAAQVGSTLLVVSPDGGAPTPLTVTGQPPGGHAAPSWSRSGRYVVFSVFDAGRDDGVYVVRVDSRAVSLLEHGRLYEAAFAEEDTEILVAGGEGVIVRLPFDPATGQRRGPRELIVVPGVPNIRGVSLSADNKVLLFASPTLTSHIWVQPIDGAGGPAGDARPLTNDTSRRNYTPAISPDGRRVAYVSARRGEAPNIWMMDIAGGAALQLTNESGFEGLPSWLSDGRHVVYAGEREGRSGVWTVDIVTRRTEPLIDTSAPPRVADGSAPIAGRLTELQLSPSGHKVAFAIASTETGFRRLYLSGLTPLLAHQLAVAETRSVGYPAWSPDERLLAVEIQDVEGTTHLGVVDVATGQLRQITRERGQVWARSWSPDGRRIAAAVLRERRWSLEWFEAATGRRGILTPPAPPHVYYRYPEWSPRGDVVVFERAEMRGNLWTLALPPQAGARKKLQHD